ncbi:MAG TPA: glycosyltransferase 87 family protein [Gaiellaceae bacterium]|nr:glycosyltransferase 87 family protein [Gaiellaceae bacterium]
MTRARGTWLGAGAACVLLGISFYTLIAWLEHSQLSDVPIYTNYAESVRHGALPYRDFAFEYPPAALPPMLLASYLSWSYATSFAVVMGVCGAACIMLAASALRAVDAPLVRAWAALLAIGVAPIVLGSLFDTRYDLWPTLLAVGALAALVWERPILSGGLLGLGFAAKLWPAVLVPIAVAYLWRRNGRRSALIHLTTFAGVAIACFLPFLILAPHGLRAMFSDQLSRPLQVESLGAAVLMAAQHLGLRPLTTISTHGAQALSGRGAGLAADLSTVFEVVAVVTIWIVFARRRDPDREAVLLAAAAAVAALVAFDRVLSPQYLIWVVPFIPLVRGTRGFYASMALFIALGFTQTYFPRHYWGLANTYQSPYSWYLLARDLALVAIAVILGVALIRGRDSAAEREGWPAVRQAGA